MKAQIDLSLCEGHAKCMEAAPDIFEVRDDDLLVVAVKSRPKGVTVLGREIIKDFRHRPPEEWGVEYAAFLKERGLSHLAATVSLPLGDLTSRQLRGLASVARRYVGDAVRTTPSHASAVKSPRIARSSVFTAGRCLRGAMRSPPLRAGGRSPTSPSSLSGRGRDASSPPSL